MGTEYEKVNGFTESEGFEDDMIIDIDLKSKQISVINDQTLIAGEINSQYISFMVARYYDGIDLSEKNIKIIYNGPTNYHSSNYAVNVMRNDESIKFGWIVPRGAVFAPGELQFAVEFINRENDDYILKIQPTAMVVLDGMSEMETDEPLGETWYNELQNNCQAALTEAKALFDAMPIPQYGICQDIASKNSKLERIGSAAGLVAEIGIGTNSAINDFDKIYPWSNIRKCTLSDDGTVTSYKGDVKYTQDGSIGQVVVEIPKYYKKLYIDEITGKEYRYICKYKLPGYELPRAFLDKNGEELEYIYIAAFLSSPDDYTVSSIANSIDYEQDKPQELSLKHKARGTNWHCLDINDKNVIEDLIMIEFATTDLESIFGNCFYYNTEVYAPVQSCYSESSNVISFIVDEYLHNQFYIGQELCIYISPKDTEYQPEGNDISREYGNMAFRTIEELSIELTEDSKRKITVKFSGNPILIDDEVYFTESTERTGITDIVAASSGRVGIGTRENVPYIWRGIENPFGYAESLIDGILLNEKGYWVTEDISAYGKYINPEATEAKEFYELLEISTPTTGYITKLGYDKKHPSCRLPEITNGASTLGYCDLFRINTAENCALTWGGNNSKEAGLFCYKFIDCIQNITMGRLAYRRYEH